MTIPSLLGNSWNAPAFAVLGLLLLVLGHRAGSWFLCAGAWVVMFFSAFNLAFSLVCFSNYLFGRGPEFFWHERIGRCLIPILVMAAACFLDRRIPHREDVPGFTKNDLPSMRSAHVVPIFHCIWFGALFLYLTLEAVAIAELGDPTFRDGAVSLLWSVFAAALLWIGLHFKRQYLRFLGLGLFAVTIVKVFLNDLAGVTTGLRVILTLVFGIVLLVSSYWYLNRDSAE